MPLISPVSDRDLHYKCKSNHTTGVTLLSQKLFLSLNISQGQTIKINILHFLEPVF
jgi:hypothetical protein